ncbi:MAG: SDR family NAD(P)-dependent oxidoreductase [Lentisphaerae bacterium]|nr:SDR family NAD(P)-dependent oxidoreductase [Lentisphaerota bacterium]
MSAARQTVLITGASGRIGTAIARALGETGRRLALVARDADKLEAARAAAGLDAGACGLFPCDVADRNGIAQTVGRIRETMGPIGVLIACAGINIANRSLRSLDPADWDNLLKINLTGTFNTVHAVLPSMREQGAGLILFLSSVSGIRPSTISGAAYSVSKAGQGVLAACIGREERGRNIRATAVYAGEVDTDFLNTRSARPGGVSASRREMILKPDDIAAAMRYIVEQPPRVRIPELVLMPAVDDFA